MSRYSKLKDQAILCAQNSNCKFKHGAIIIKGNRVVCRGYNNDRSSFLGKLDYQQHAEMNVVTKFFNQNIRRNPDILKNIHRYKILVVRISNNEDHKTVSSGPCITCVNRLKDLGFRYLIYSNENDELQEINLKTYSHQHFTSTYSKRYAIAGNDINLFKKMDLIHHSKCICCKRKCKCSRCNN